MTVDYIHCQNPKFWFGSFMRLHLRVDRIRSKTDEITRINMDRTAEEYYIEGFMLR